MRLHDRLGANPRVVYIHCLACTQTKDDSIALLGSSNVKDMCPKCKTWVYGGVKHRDVCPKCKHPRDTNYDSTWERKELSDTEHIHQTGVCQQCQKYMQQGIILISVDESKSDDLSNPYRTGGWVVVKEEAVRRMLPESDVTEQICQKRMSFVPDDVWDQLGLPRGEVEGVPSE
jgi:hypothetical protein